MALVYLVNKTQISSKIAWCLFFILEYYFKVIHKHGCSHFLTNALFRLPNIT